MTSPRMFGPTNYLKTPLGGANAQVELHGQAGVRLIESGSARCPRHGISEQAIFHLAEAVCDVPGRQCVPPEASRGREQEIGGRTQSRNAVLKDIEAKNSEVAGGPE